MSDNLRQVDIELLAAFLGKASFAQGSVLHEPGQPITRVIFLRAAWFHYSPCCRKAPPSTPARLVATAPSA
jgi:hypothetical protein